MIITSEDELVSAKSRIAQIGTPIEGSTVHLEQQAFVQAAVEFEAQLAGEHHPTNLA